MDVNQLKCPPFPADEDKMINSTRIRVARNLAAYSLGTAVTRKERLEVESLVTSALSEFTGELKGKYYSLPKMTPAEKKGLIEDHFLVKGGELVFSILAPSSSQIP
jgi:protein-arginine kinase